MKTTLHTKILPELAKKHKFEIINYSSKDISTIKNGKKVQNVYYFEFNCNNLTNAIITKDKSQVYKILSKNNIDAVEHTYLNYATSNETALEYLYKHGKIVVKKQDGTCGEDVFLVTNKDELFKAINILKIKGQNINICPYINIEKECRAICINGDVELIYEKDRPYVIGNGMSTVTQLSIAKYNTIFSNIKSYDLIPAKNQKIFLTWQHNLCKGSTPIVLTDSYLKTQIKDLAIKTANVLGLNCCSVDCVLSKGSLKVLEVNSGIMMEKFAEQSTANYLIAKNIYEKLLISGFKPAI